MTEITRETLELAALAAGHKVYGWCVGDGGITYYADIGPDESVAWRPHLDDGDAARLAVRLEITVAHIAEPVPRWAADHDSLDTFHSRAHDGTEADRLSAWREAVTLCAAAVGERVREGGA